MAASHSESRHAGAAAARQPAGGRAVSAASLTAALAVVGAGSWRLLAGASDQNADFAARVYALSRQGFSPLPAGLAPDDLLVYHVMGYASLTDAFDRHSAVAGVTLEVMIVIGVLTAALMWPLARRLGLGRLTSCAAVLVAGLAPPLLSLDRTLQPASLAVLWLLSAAALTVGVRLRPLPVILAVAASSVAALLAPLTLVLVGAMFGAGVWDGELGRRWRPRTRGTVLAAATVATAGGLALSIWSPRPEPTSGTAITAAAPVVVVAAVLVALAALAAWQLPGLRAAAAGLGVVAVVALLVQPLQPPVLILAAPVAALLFGGLAESGLRAERGTGRPWLRRLGPALAAVVVAAALAGAGTAAAAPAGSAAAADPAAIKTWLEENVDPAATVHVDRRTWAELVHAGLPADRITLDGATTSPAQTGFWIHASAEPAFGAPVAAFGTDGQTQISYCAPLSAAAGDADNPCGVSASTAADRQARIRFGGQLLANPALSFASAARQALGAGGVDARLLLVIAGISSEHALAVEDFPAQPGDVPEALRRTVVIDSVDGRLLADGNPAAGAVADWLAAQQPPYRPPAIELSRDELIVRYYLPNVVGLLED